MNDDSKENVNIDLSKQGLKQIKPLWDENDQIESIILDDNELTTLDGLGQLLSLQELSASKNKIRRMSCLSQFINLCSLDLSNNSIVCIEGLKALRCLKHINLSGNYIKMIDHLSENLELEYLDLSDNAIGHINDISYLTHLKEFYLHKNHISHLRLCERYLPACLEVLTLSDNKISDLCDVSHLEKLVRLKQLAVKGNPCLDAANIKPGFNYRPFIKMWCLNLSVVDDSPLDPLESLKAEWLYSQGRGRRFRPGEHDSLVSFLTGACPLTTKTIGAEEDRKLLLILSKAEQYKQQLRDQGDDRSSRMVSSYHDTVARHSARASPEVMSRSLDCTVLRNSPPSSQKPTPTNSARSGTPLQAATVLVPVPESLVSPDVCRPLLPPTTQKNGKSPLVTPPVRATPSPHSTPGSRRRSQRQPSPTLSPKSTPTKIVRKARDTEETNEMSAGKLHNIQLRASQKRHKNNEPGKIPKATSKKINDDKPVTLKFQNEKTSIPDCESNTDVWKAALCIQRRWRGYRARSCDPIVTEACRTIQASRMQDYIIKVAEDMAAAKTALEGNRKLQVLQMKAIDAVWRKLDGSDVEGLAASCINLTKQVEELRGLVQMLQTNGHHPAPPVVPIATQTDIIAVTTPQSDAVFPIPLLRPSDLNLSDDSDKVEPVCLTPACQEGRDLQGIDSPTISLD